MNWFDKVMVNQAKLEEISYNLDDIANAFLVTGNLEMYKALKRMGDDIDSIQKSTRKIVGEKVSGDYKQAEQSAWNTVSKALAVATKGKE